MSNANFAPVYSPKTVHSFGTVSNLYDDGEVTCGACQLTIGFTFDKPFYSDGISAANRRYDDAGRYARAHQESCVAQ